MHKQGCTQAIRFNRFKTSMSEDCNRNPHVQLGSILVQAYIRGIMIPQLLIVSCLQFRRSPFGHSCHSRSLVKHSSPTLLQNASCPDFNSSPTQFPHVTNTLQSHNSSTKSPTHPIVAYLLDRILRIRHTDQQPPLRHLDML
jgi:hypothetical protein